MCLTQSSLRRLNRWNWDGDHIVFESIVPSSRLPIGRVKGRAYDIDVREFLVSENNAVTKRVLREALPEHFNALNRATGRTVVDLDALTRRGPGDFDMRAHLIASYVSATIRYKKSPKRKKGDPPDAWQFPDETLSLRQGDCEDIAFLLASLLLASGISGYNVRVALGQVIHLEGSAEVLTFDHMWVMYKCEAGHWLVLEPLRLDDHRPQRPRGTADGLAKSVVPAPALEYRPCFVFNCDHLWRVEDKDNRTSTSFQAFIRRDWSRLDPGFVGCVHQTLLHEALDGIAPRFVLDALDRHFSRIVGNTVEDIDLATQNYDCRDHFDNGFIAEGWQRVNERLEAFGANNSDLDAFAYAAHGIADFYAHSAYLHFARVSDGAAAPYDPDQPTAGLARAPDYSAGSDFDIGSGSRFTRNGQVFSGTAAQAATAWRGKSISGRYAQRGASPDPFEALTFIPRALLKSPGFARRGGLPHHEEIAVDDVGPKASHLLYSDVPDPAPSDHLAYGNQFNWRKNTAVLHIRQAFVQRWKNGAWG